MHCFYSRPPIAGSIHSRAFASMGFVFACNINTNTLSSGYVKRSWLWTGAAGKPWGTARKQWNPKCVQRELGPTSKAAFPSICHNFLLHKVPTTVCTLRVHTADCFGPLPHSAIWKAKLALPPQLHRSIISQAYSDFIWGMYKIES